MAYFPLFIQLEGRRCLVAGGGPVGLRKAAVLARFGGQVTVVSPAFCPGFDSHPELTLCRRVFQPSDLDGVELAVATTDSRQVNGEIARLCREREIPVDVADCGAEGTFLFPAVCRRGEVTVGISTGGGAPALAGEIRRRVEQLLPLDLDEVRGEMERLRAEGRLRPGEAARLWPEEPQVYLVGAGCGDPGLITWRGLELVCRCNVLIYDRLAAPELVELARPDCERIDVGKAPGRHSMPQDEIEALLIDRARPGKLVVRLKGGDSFVFGRGGEEAQALQRAGIPFEVVPGVTSAVAAPEAAGIPVTHRGLARSFHVITGHTARTEEGPDYGALARLEGTLVFLMGVESCPALCAGLLEAGKEPRTPAAAVYRGTTPAQRTVRSTLAELPRAVEEAGLAAPAVLVIGPVAALDLRSENRQT